MERWEENLQQEIDRLEEEIAKRGIPHCPPSKGISAEVGLIFGLRLRKTVFEDALRFDREGAPEATTVFPFSKHQRVRTMDGDEGIIFALRMKGAQVRMDGYDEGDLNGIEFYHYDNLESIGDDDAQR